MQSQIFFLTNNFRYSCSQLVIKAEVDSSLRLGRQVDMENLPLGQFFVILDLVLTNIFCYSYSQLVIKAVVDSSLRLGRQVDMENLPLRQFFVILDLVFRHGFKSGTGSIKYCGSGSDLWRIGKKCKNLYRTCCSGYSIRDPRV